MKTLIKKTLTALILAVGTVNIAQAAELTCGNGNISLEIFYGQGPRGDDLIILQMENGDELEFVTGISSAVTNTRCGLEKRESAELFLPNIAMGMLNIRSAMDANICGISSNASVNVEIEGEHLSANLLCN